MRLDSALLLAATGALAFLGAPTDADAGPRSGRLSRTGLTAPEDASGRVRLQRPGRRAAALLVRIRNMDPDSRYGVRDAQGGGSLGSVPTDDSGRGRLRLSSDDVPGGRATLLSGMELEVVHESTGEVVLEGRVENHDANDGHDGRDGGGDASSVREAAAVYEAEGGVRAALWMRSDPEHGSESMALRVSGLSEEGTYTLFLSDGADGMDEVADLALDDNDFTCEATDREGHETVVCEGHLYWEWDVDTADGEELPGGAESLDDLVGRRLEVRDGEGNVILDGEVPHFREETPDDGGGDREAEVHEGAAEYRGEGEVHGAMWIRSDPAHHSERMALKVAGLGEDGTFTLFMEDGEHDALAEVAGLVRDGGYAWYWVDTAEGGSLPFGAEEVRSLSGRRFEVRDAEGHVVLDGEVPHFRSEEPPPTREVREAAVEFETDAGVHGAMWIRSDPAHESERMVLKVAGLPEDGRYVLFMGDGEHDALDDVAVLEREGGYWWYWRDTAEGQSLPFGVEEVGSLSGRRWEVRDGEGHSRCHGEVPHFRD